MGRIKSTMIKRTARELLEKNPELLTKDFDHNKKVLGSEMPSKPLRNKIAGYITRLKRNTQKLINEKEDENDWRKQK